MRFIFLPKHQRLVNQCYPSGNTTDKKPNSSETSYLLYYVNSRRSKLEKVSSFLVKRTATDLHRKRVGNVAVTLELLIKIINNCKENLNVFIKDFFGIMLSVLSNNNFNNDYSIVELLEMAFGSICTSVDEALYSGDAEFIKNYSKFTNMFFEVVDNKIHNDVLLLKICKDISDTESLASNPQLNKYIGRSVTFTLKKFQEKYPVFKDVTDKPTANLLNLNRRLSRMQSKSIWVDSENIDENDFCVKVLQSLFNTTETDKLTLSVNALIDTLHKTPNKYLLSFIANTIPVQLRYIIILLLVRRLTHTNKIHKSSHSHSHNRTSDDNDKSKIDNHDPLVTLKLISFLLTSDVSIVGLSVLDIMKKVLQFQMDNVKDSSLSNESCYTIKFLNYKTFYRGQSFDMLYELFVRLKPLKDKELDNLKNKVLVNDIEELIYGQIERFITLEFFNELSPIVPHLAIHLFKLTINDTPKTESFHKFFHNLQNMKGSQLSQTLMHEAFQKYGKYALLAGLNYFLLETKEPNETYYNYHSESSKFLNLKDYQSQLEFKRQNEQLFDRDDLLNYYSDNGSNKYSTLGASILSSMTQDHDLSSDLEGNANLDTTNFNITSNGNTTIISNNGVESIVSTPTEPYEQLTVDKNQNIPINRKPSVYRLVSDDIRSWKSSRTKTPKIKDLKKVVRQTGKNKDIDDDKNNRGSKFNGVSLHGSQSVKSRVTNITFLLSELKSNNGSLQNGTRYGADKEYGNIPDPDEEEIVGLNKMNMARTQSVRLSYNASSDFRKSMNIKKNELIDTALEVDEFEDAQEDVTESTARGKLFIST